MCVCECVCACRCVSCAVPEFELAAHLSMFDLYELVIAGRHTAALHEPLEAKRGEKEREREGENWMSVYLLSSDLLCNLFTSFSHHQTQSVPRLHRQHEAAGVSEASWRLNKRANTSESEGKLCLDVLCWILHRGEGGQRAPPGLLICTVTQRIITTWNHSHFSETLLVVVHTCMEI